MKKTVKSILAAALCVIIVFACAACAGKTNSNSEAVGTWKLRINDTVFQSMTEEEASATKAYFEALDFSVILNADGTADITGNIGGGAESGKGSWSQTGDQVYLINAQRSGGNAIKFTLKDGKLFFDAELISERYVDAFYLSKV